MRLSHCAGGAPLREDELDLGMVQNVRRYIVMAAIAAAGIAILLVRPAFPDELIYHFWTEYPGYAAITAAVGIRLWCTLHIGGAKNRTLVTSGPYSVTRNPLYFASILGAVGIGLQTGMLTFAVIGGLVTWAIFAWVVRREERFLSATFGPDYAAYCARTPRFLPQLSLFDNGGDVHSFSSARLWHTFRDSSLFFLIIPLTELLEAAHDFGWLPAMLTAY